MGDRKGEHVVLEISGGAVAAPPQRLATQAQALARQTQSLASLAKAVADQAQVLSDQAPADQALALVAPNDEERAEKSVFAYKEITNLYDINVNYPILKLALEDWQRKEEYLSNSITRRERQSAELTNQIYSILGIFAIFVGLVLTAVSQLTQNASIESGGAPLCGKIWFPIVLTGFATVVTIVGILYKFTSLQSLESTIYTERQAKIEIAYRASCLRREGPKRFKFHSHTDKFRPAPQSKFVKKRFFVIVSLVIFTFVLILSYFVILCDTWVG